MRVQLNDSKTSAWQVQGRLSGFAAWWVESTVKHQRSEMYKAGCQFSQFDQLKLLWNICRRRGTRYAVSFCTLTVLNCCKTSALGDVPARLPCETSALGDVPARLSCETSALGDVPARLSCKTSALGGVQSVLWAFHKWMCVQLIIKTLALGDVQARLAVFVKVDESSITVKTSAFQVVQSRLSAVFVEVNEVRWSKCSSHHGTVTTGLKKSSCSGESV